MEITPRDGAEIPPKPKPAQDHGGISPETMAEIDKITSEEVKAFQIMAQAALRSADAAEDAADYLNDIRDIMICVVKGIPGMTLPLRLQDLDVNEDAEDDAQSD